MTPGLTLISLRKIGRLIKKQTKVVVLVVLVVVAELVMGWVHPWVRLGWVGFGWVRVFLIFGGLGWVGWRLDCVIFLTSRNTLLSVN